MYDVTVIGCGVVGALIARELTKYDLKICILEKENDVACGASKANSGIVHAGFDAPVGSYKARFNVAGNRMMAPLCRNLGVPYRNNGSLVIAFTEDDMKTVRELYDRGEKNGVPGLMILDAKELHLREKNVSEKAVGALYAPTSGIVCPYSLTIAACGNAMDNGAHLKRNFKVVSAKRGENGAYELLSETGERVLSRYVINAAGLFSDEIARLVGDDSFTVHPRAGEYMLLDKSVSDLCTHTVFRTPTAMGKGILVSPTTHGNLLLGPTSVDTQDKNDHATTPEGLAKVALQALEDVPDVPVRAVITSFTGLRAVGSTGDFIIRRSAEKFISLGGIESPGLSSAPAIARYVVALLKKDGLKDVRSASFNPKRKAMRKFSEMTNTEKNRVIRRNPDYGTVVCRCETITKGDILDALRTNPKALDLDGVKRRTRSGMGRCQGGFCSPLVARLIAEETGIPQEKVTKKGPGSEILFAKTK